jgi:polyisoprenoid-binding protein YceI
MKKILLFSLMGIAAVLSSFVPVRNSNSASRSLTAPASLWTADKPHTSVKFSVSHLVISDVEGVFKSFDGTMESSKPDFSDAKINFTVDVNSLNTDNEKRDGHLKSDDFFNAEKYPQIKFVSTSFTPLGGSKYKLTGNLTIRDVTKPVTFDVNYGGTVTAMGKVHAGFKATAKVDRFDYNLKWNMATEAGGAIVGKEVEIIISAEFIKG